MRIRGAFKKSSLMDKFDDFQFMLVRLQKFLLLAVFFKNFGKSGQLLVICTDEYLDMPRKFSSAYFLWRVFLAKRQFWSSGGKKCHFIPSHVPLLFFVFPGNNSHTGHWEKKNNFLSGNFFCVKRGDCFSAKDHVQTSTKKKYFTVTKIVVWIVPLFL